MEELYLERKIDAFLSIWKQNNDRKPLIVKGPRQVGKTESIKKFAGGNYESFIEYYYLSNIEFMYNYENAPTKGYYWIDDLETGETLMYLPPNPTREGYEFIGWFLSEDSEGNGVGTEVGILTPVTTARNHTLYANWGKNYTVTFDANGGTTPISSKRVSVNGTYGNLPTPTKSGYTFIGWSGEIYNITTNTTFEANYIEGESDFSGKTVSILGDSGSTYKGYVPDGYSCFYPYPTADLGATDP